MRKHYLVLAHDAPAQVLRLVQALDDGESTFWLHVDGKASLDAWGDVIDQASLRLVEPRVPCAWGTWSLVEATLAMLRAVLASGAVGYIALLSGQSYPIRSREATDAYLSHNVDRIHLQSQPIEEALPDNYGNRLNYFTIALSGEPGDLALMPPRPRMSLRERIGWRRKLTHRLGFSAAHRILAVTDRPRPDIEGPVYSGSQWFGFPWSVAEEMVSFIDRHPAYEGFFRWSQYPDEMFFATVAQRLYGDRLAEMSKPSLMYVDWTAGDWDLPRVLGVDDIPTLLAQPEHILFARKFYPHLSGSALDRIDEARGLG